MSESPVLASRDGAVLTVTLNLPDRRNPISDPAMVDALCDVFEAADRDASIHVAILTGAGSAFSSGGDLNAMRPDAGGLRASLPAGVEVVETYDRSTLIQRAVDNLNRKLLDEFIVVALVCLVFLVRLVLSPARQARFDAHLRRTWHRLKLAAHQLRHWRRRRRRGRRHRSDRAQVG